MQIAWTRGRAVAAALTLLLGAGCADPVRLPSLKRLDPMSATTSAALGDSVALVGRYEVRDNVLRTSVAIRNVTTRRVHLEWGDCSLRILLFASPDTSARPAFDSFVPRTTLPQGCKDYRALLDLEPGKEYLPEEFTDSLGGPDIAGDSLRSGTYYLSPRVLLLEAMARTGVSAWYALPAAPLVLR
ncbi:MAG TPA: hypothetical protein VGD77_04870 [Gemmatimonadaceae bacterium]